MSELKVKIRGSETKLDLSGMDLTAIPDAVFNTTSLETLDISNNKISSLDRIGTLRKLKNLYAQKNRIGKLPTELRDLDKLENLRLDGNMVAVMNTDLAVVFGTSKIKAAFDIHFGTSSESPASKSSDTSSSSKPSFLTSTTDLNNVSFLRKKIADLQLEITDLKAGGSSGPSKSIEEQKDWLGASGRGGFGARPTTASSQVGKIKDLEDDLKHERKSNKILINEVTLLKSEISKAKILTSIGGDDGRLPSSSKSYSSDSIGSVSGVMEIPYEELEMGDQIGQGGFSVIKKGTWRNTDVAIKIIFDPVITDELIADIRNEVEMLSILRHPKIVLLMGMSSKPPNLAIVFENMPKGCLFDLLHTTKVELSMEKRVHMAYEIATIFAFLHKSGVVHRDLKSYNILVDNDLNIKLCDFGLCKFKADLNRGTMQFSGTPVYMAPELFQKKSYDEKVDVFAFGTLLWELVARDVPFDGLEASDIKEMVMAEEHLKVPFGVNKKIATLIKDSRALNPSKRPDFEYIQGVLQDVIS